MKKKNNNDDYIYSYVERRMVNTRDPLDNGRGDSKGFINLIKIILLVIVIGTGIYFKDDIRKILTHRGISEDSVAGNGKIGVGELLGVNEVHVVKELADRSHETIDECNELISFCTDKYNQLDFSKENKSEVQRRIDSIETYNTIGYSEEKYGSYINYIDNLKRLAVKYGEFFISIEDNTVENTEIARNTVDTYHSEVKRYSDVLTDILIKNNIKYIKEEDNTIRFWK